MGPDHNQPRYFFDLNNFDEPEVEEVDPDAPPPPPVFSLEEMIAARENSFEDGKNTGLEEARVSREQYIAEQIQRVKESFEGLIAAEKSRDDVFEREVVALCQEIFTKAFPAMNRREGLNEVLSVVHGVLHQHASPGNIQVMVPADEVEEVAARLNVLAKMIEGFDPTRLSVEAGPDLQKGSCKVRWKDGSAQRDHKGLADAILSRLEQTLAPAGIKGEDKQ